VDRLTSAQHRLAAAIDLPGLLDAAYDAFEDMLGILRHQQDDESAFPAFVMAAAAAANGRDWIAGVEGLPSVASRDRDGDLSADTTAADVAKAVAALSREVAARLTAVAASTRSAGDRQYCERAAAEAVAITTLLGGANSP